MRASFAPTLIFYERRSLFVMLENKFKTELKKEIEARFPGAIVSHLRDPQGIPDLIVLYKDKWAALEGKKSSHEKKQPNQDYYVDKLNHMSFARVIYPENKEEVLNDMAKSFKP